MKQSEKKEIENNFIYNSKVVFVYSIAITFSLAFNSLMNSILQTFTYRNKMFTHIIHMLVVFIIFISATIFFNMRITP